MWIVAYCENHARGVNGVVLLVGLHQIVVQCPEWLIDSVDCSDGSEVESPLLRGIGTVDEVIF